MTMRGRVKSRTQVRDLSFGQSQQVQVAGATAFVFVLQGNINVQAAVETYVHTLQAEETLRLDFSNPLGPGVVDADCGYGCGAGPNCRAVPGRCYRWRLVRMPGEQAGFF